MSNATLSIPRAPKLPSDLAALEANQPDANGGTGWIAKLERAAGRERTAYIAALIVDARRNG